MLVDVNVRTKTQIDITPEEAFRILCKTLEMECVLENDGEYSVAIDGDIDWLVVQKKFNDGSYETYDDRGELFVALSNVAVQMFPNCDFSCADYIYHYGEE